MTEWGAFQKNTVLGMGVNICVFVQVCIYLEYYFGLQTMEWNCRRIYYCGSDYHVTSQNYINHQQGQPNEEADRNVCTNSVQNSLPINYSLISACDHLHMWK